MIVVRFKPIGTVHNAISLIIKSKFYYFFIISITLSFRCSCQFNNGFECCKRYSTKERVERRLCVERVWRPVEAILGTEEQSTIEQIKLVFFLINPCLLL